MMFSVPSVATASDTMLPTMIFSNAAKSWKQGPRAWTRYGNPLPSDQRCRLRR